MIALLLFAVQAPPNRTMTLREVVAAAAAAPAIASARADRDAARAAALQDRPVAVPDVALTGDAGAQTPTLTFPRPDGSDAPVLRTALARLSLSVDQPLYAPGLGAARALFAGRTAAADKAYAQAQADTSAAVLQACVALLRAQSGLRAAQDEAAAADSARDLAHNRLAAGTIAPVAVAAADADAAEAHAAVVRAESARDLAQLDVARRAGLARADTIELRDLADPPTPPHGADEAIATALTRRPDVGAAQGAARAAAASTSLARGEGGPSLSLHGELTEQTPTAFVPGSYAAAMLRIRIPIGPSGRAQADIAAARAQQARADADLAQLRDGIRLEVTRAVRGCIDAQAKLDAAHARLTAAEAADRVARTALEVDRGTIADANAARHALNAARSGVEDARLECWSAAFELRHAEGLPAEAILPAEGIAR